MDSKNGLKTLLRNHYKEIAVVKPFVKKLSAKVYMKRNKNIIEAEFKLNNLFTAHLNYFVSSIEKVFDSCLRDRIGDRILTAQSDIPSVQKVILHYFKLEHKQLIDFMLDYGRSEPAELNYIHTELLCKFKYFYNDSIEAGVPIYNAFLKDIKFAVEHNNLTAIVALSLYNDLWIKLSKDVKRNVEKFNSKHKEAVRARGLSTSEKYYPVRSKIKQDVRLISKKRYDDILKIFSLDYDLSHSSERAQAKVLQSKDSRTSLGSKREFFTQRPNDADEMKVSSIEENRNQAKLIVGASVTLQTNPIWYCVARREFMYDIRNPFFNESILQDKKIKIADKQRYELIQKLRTDGKLLNSYLNEMDQNIVDCLKLSNPTSTK